MGKLIFIATVCIVGVAVAALSYSMENTSQSSKHSLPDWQTEQNILETVFKYQLHRCRRDYHSKVYFLSYKKQDPPDGVVTKFANYAVSVRKRSQMRDFIDTKTGEQGILVSITKIDQSEKSRAQVFSSCIAGDLDANHYAYRLRRKKGVWRVTHERLVGVS